MGSPEDEESERVLDSYRPPPRSSLHPNLRREVGELVLDTTTEGVWLIDVESRTTFANLPLSRMLGYGAEEMIGQSVFSFMDDDWRRVCERNIGERKAGVGGQVEFKLRRKDGGEVWVLLTSNPVHDRRGRYAGALATIINISERKRIEMDLERSLSELEKRVEERTRELFEANQRLVELTYRDEVTGLYNRRYLRERLDQEAARSKRRGATFCLLFIDIDHFKTYNDRLGHARGDDLLRRLGQMLMPPLPTEARAPLLRGSDVAARWGGEEFLVFAPDTDLEGAGVLAERLRASVPGRLRLPAEVDLSSPRVTLSIGVAEWERHARDVDGLVASADRAMYAAKGAGRDRVCVAEPLPRS